MAQPPLPLPCPTTLPGRRSATRSTTSVGAPPGFASTVNLKPPADIDAMMSLNLIDVKMLAKQEQWRCVYTSQQDSVVSFCVDRAGETIRVNVFYNKAVVGIMFSHPRMGHTQSFRHQVVLSDLRKIFRDPRVHTGDGYSNIKRKKKNSIPPTYSYIGDRVHVQGYEDAVIVGEPKGPGELAKIRFANGEVYRVETSRLSLVDRPHLGCKTLDAEAEMQLERLDNELDRIMIEKMRCEKILGLQRFGGPGNHDVNMNHSPKRDDVQSSNPCAVVGAFGGPSSFTGIRNDVNMSYSPNRTDVSLNLKKAAPSHLALVGAFEPYKPSKGSNGVSIWSSEGNDTKPSTPSMILPPFFPTNY